MDYERLVSVEELKDCSVSLNINVKLGMQYSIN